LASQDWQGVKAHKAVLCWQCEEDKRPGRTAYWLMIDEVLPGAVKLFGGKKTGVLRVAPLTG
jgi:hypothetical protein